MLDRVAGKQKADDTAMDTTSDVDILSISITKDEKSAMDERKLAHLTQENGVKLQSHSSVSRSWTTFARSFECSTYQYSTFFLPLLPTLIDK